MDEQYPKFVVDSRLARSRLAQAFESSVDLETQRRFSPVSDRTYATSPKKNAGKGKRSMGGRVRLITSCVYRTLVKQLGTARRDISGFGFLFVLARLCENAPAQTDYPVFWLLVSPTPLTLL
jgi:hypothetical protein